MSAATVLLLGGTAEARDLASRLDTVAGARVVSSLAGRVSRPALPVGEVRIGGFGGADGLARWLREQRATALVDATHPYAATISHNAAVACKTTGTPLLRLERPPWTPTAGDRWHEVEDLRAAADLLPSLGRRVFLTTGRQDLAAFTGSDLWFLIRCVDPPAGPVPLRAEVLLARGPYDAVAERELMVRHAIDVLVTKNSGGEHTAGKLRAARELRLPVVVVSRPPVPPGAACGSVDDAVAWVMRRMSVSSRVSSRTSSA